MAIPRTSTLALTVIAFLSFNSFSQKLGFEEVLEKQPDRITTFCVPANSQNLRLLEDAGVTIKYSASEWAFISATPRWIDDQIIEGALTDFYFEMAPPSLLSDSARMHHFVDDVHAGNGGLNSSYTGKGVIIGYVDTGIDYNHEDFIDPDGNTRVLRYWDQTMPDNASSPDPYGYGFVWDSSAINDQTCTSIDVNAHGTTVAGQGSGNGSATGTNMGMAPESDIIIVETDFTRPNWTLTVADACDFVFKVADSLGKPAVVNLSLGTYVGSHDGNDPAAEAIEAMLDAQGGRIVVAAAGNSGQFLGYHVHMEPTVDTNFVWFITNPTGVLGGNAVIFDLWTEVADATWDYSISVDRPNPDWSLAGETVFRDASSSVGTTIFDTIRNANFEIMCTVEIQTEISGGAYHMMTIMRNCDSVGAFPYLYRFNATESGKLDLWSSTTFGWNRILMSLMDSSLYPAVVNYVYADTNQSIVSSWNCSEKIVSVGNMRNRSTFVNANYVTYTPSDNTPVGQISPNSSWGPNRQGLNKPDISAAGDISLSAGPLALVTNPANFNLVDSAGMHILNGGTSLASPVIAGIAALYLERCGMASYQDFKDDLIATAYTDSYTGTVPNNRYGYGKAHALNTLLETTPATTPTILSDWSTSLTSSAANGYLWFLDGNVISGEINQDLFISPPYGSYQVRITDPNGCTAFSDPFVVTLSLEENDEDQLFAFPNPTSGDIQLTAESPIYTVHLISSDGSRVKLPQQSAGVYSLKNAAQGAYTLEVETEKGIYFSKVIRF